MSRHFLRNLLCSVTAALIMSSFPLPADALHNWASSYVIDVEIENAPDEAAYIDILVPALNIDDFEEYHDTKIDDVKNAGIRTDQNSGIAGYIDNDGFISLSAHTDCIMLNSTYRYVYNEKTNILGHFALRKDDSEHDANWLKDTFKRFKIAFVDKKGSVISVTDTADDSTVPDQEYPIIRMSGDRPLTFCTHVHYTTFENIAILTVFLAMLVTFVLLIKGIIKGIKNEVKGRRERRGF